MKINKLIILSVVPMLLLGCDKTEKKETNTKEKGVVKINLPATLNTSKSYYKQSYKYDNEFFSHSATEFNDDLKMLSFASAMVTLSEDMSKSFFETMFFDNVECFGYDQVTTDSIGYTLAHKEIDNYHLIGINVRGLNYGAEWCNNFTLGESGNHVGFTNSANEIYAAISNYISSYEDASFKMWITGYSRGGGVANVLADQIMYENSFGLDQNKLYVYTFEAPAGIAAENKVAYPNVFNMINSQDLVPEIPPRQYGLVRCGIDVNINNINVKTWTKSFDKGIYLHDFTPDASKGYTTAEEFLAHFIELLIEDNEEAPAEQKEAFVGTRSEYYQNVQNEMCYLLGFIMNQPSSVLNKIINALRSSVLIIASAYIMSDYEAIYNIIYPKLDESHVQYDPEVLKPAVVKITKYAFGRKSLLEEAIDYSSMSISQTFLNNVMLTVDLHFPEMSYILLSNQRFGE